MWIAANRRKRGRWSRYLAAMTVSLSIFEAGAQTGGIADDRAHRDLSIHWPRAFDPGKAPVFSHNELLIHADCHRVWTRLLDVTDWPNWFVLTKDVTIDGSDKTVRQGTLLRLKIFGMPITSRIDEFAPDSRLSWIPQGLDEATATHYHTWRFVRENTGCRVTTEETGIGPNDVKSPAAGSRVMHQAHDLWLASLRWAAEQ